MFSRFSYGIAKGTVGNEAVPAWVATVRGKARMLSKQATSKIRRGVESDRSVNGEMWDGWPGAGLVGVCES